MKLDADTIKILELPLGKTDVIFFDDDLIGFGIRLRGDGGRLRRSWITQYRVKGRTRRFRIGDVETINAKRARDAAGKVLANVKLGNDPQSKKEEDRKIVARTLKSVADEYLEMKKFEMDKGKYRPASYRVTKLYLTGKAYFGPLHTTDHHRNLARRHRRAPQCDSRATTAASPRDALDPHYRACSHGLCSRDLWATGRTIPSSRQRNRMTRRRASAC